MKKLILSGIVILGLIIIIILVFELLTTPDGAEPFIPASITMQGETVYIEKGNLYAPFFRDPYETVFFIFWNGEYYSFSTHHGTAVFSDVGIVTNYLFTTEKRKPEDLALIVHNHMTPNRFSPKDTKTFFILKEMGFKGWFCIYFPYNKIAIRKEHLQ